MSAMACGRLFISSWATGLWAVRLSAVYRLQTEGCQLSIHRGLHRALVGLLVGHSGAHNWRLGSAQGVKIS